MHADNMELCLHEIHDEADAIRVSIEGAFDVFEAINSTHCLEYVMGLGVLLEVVRKSRARAWALSRKVPSPNQVIPELREAIHTVSQGVFGFIEATEMKEKAILQLAESAMCRFSRANITLCAQQPKS
jgi:hypothetical protein